MLVVAIIAFCLVLLVLAFLAPRLSRYFQKAGDKPSAWDSGPGSKAPGRSGRWLQKPFAKTREAIRKSGSTGRRGRARAPF